MIASISGDSPYLAISGGSLSLSVPYVNLNSNNPAAGQLRLNGTSMEVYNGSAWTPIQMNHVSIGLNGDAISVLDWAQKKMVEETRLHELASKNVTVADALAQYELAQEQLKMILILTDKQ
jgi:hypothetical protein